MGNVAARKAGLKGPAAEATVALGSAAVAVEVFAWSERHEGTTPQPRAAQARATRSSGWWARASRARSSSRWAARRWRRSCAWRPSPKRLMAAPAVRERLAPEVFRLPVERIREGYYSDAYFNFTRELLEREDRHPRVLMQVFQRKDSVLGGIDEAIAILKQCAGHDGSGWDQLEVHALHEGDEISPWETVMTDRGRLLAVRPPGDGLPGLAWPAAR